MKLKDKHFWIFYFFFNSIIFLYEIVTAEFARTSFVALVINSCIYTGVGAWK